MNQLGNAARSIAASDSEQRSAAASNSTLESISDSETLHLSHSSGATRTKKQNSPNTEVLLEKLKRDRIPSELREQLKILPENTTRSKQFGEQIRGVIQKFLPTFDFDTHPVRVLLSGDKDFAAARIKHTPTTTLVFGAETMAQQESETEVALIVLHELFHGLVAKGYRPQEIFDPEGIEPFHHRAQREAQTPDSETPDLGKVEEGAAYTIPLLLIAEQGYDPRVYHSFYEKLFAEQKGLRLREEGSIAREIIDDHPLPETTDALCEATCAYFIAKRGALPTRTGEDSVALQDLLQNAHYISPTEREFRKLAPETFSEKLECLTQVMSSKLDERFLDRDTTELFQKRCLDQRTLLDKSEQHALHELAEAAFLNAHSELFRALCESTRSLLGNQTDILGQTVCAFAQARRDFIKAVGSEEQSKIEATAKTLAAFTHTLSALPKQSIEMLQTLELPSFFIPSLNEIESHLGADRLGLRFEREEAQEYDDEYDDLNSWQSRNHTQYPRSEFEDDDQEYEQYSWEEREVEDPFDEEDEFEDDSLHPTKLPPEWEPVVALASQSDTVKDACYLAGLYHDMRISKEDIAFRHLDREDRKGIPPIVKLGETLGLHWNCAIGEEGFHITSSQETEEINYILQIGAMRLRRGIAQSGPIPQEEQEEIAGLLSLRLTVEARSKGTILPPPTSLVMTIPRYYTKLRSSLRS